VGAAAQLIPTLLAEDGVTLDQVLMGDELAAYLAELMAAAAQTGATENLLKTAFADSEAYHTTWLAAGKKGKK
jgi:hypothetical protein